MDATLAFAALFAAAFMAIEHRRSAPNNWQRSRLSHFEVIKAQTLHGTPRRRIAFLLLFVVSVLVTLLLPLKGRFQFTPIIGITSAWLCWEVCSVIWSVNARLSLRRLPPWIITAGVGLVVGASLGLERSIMVIALVCCAFQVTGICNELFYRPRELPISYRFAGTLHPNTQALNCAILAFSCCWLGSDRSIPSGVAIAGMIGGLVILVLTRSRAAFWSAEAAAVIWTALSPASSSRIWPFGLAIGLFLAGIAVSVYTKALFAGNFDETLTGLVLLGRTKYASTLNRRTLLWQIMLSDMAPHWILGYGFGAYWDVRRLETIQAQIGLSVWSCHSAPLEVLVRSGVIGTILFAAMSLTSIVAALNMHGAAGAFLASMFVFVLLEGLLDSFFALPGFSALFLFLLLGALTAVC